MLKILNNLDFEVRPHGMRTLRSYSRQSRRVPVQLNWHDSLNYSQTWFCSNSKLDRYIWIVLDWDRCNWPNNCTSFKTNRFLIRFIYILCIYKKLVLIFERNSFLLTYLLKLSRFSLSLNKIIENLPALYDQYGKEITCLADYFPTF